MAKPTMRVPSSGRRSNKKDQKGRTGRLETFDDPGQPSTRFDKTGRKTKVLHMKHPTKADVYTDNSKKKQYQSEGYTVS
jgi:hypothetical protein